MLIIKDYLIENYNGLRIIDCENTTSFIKDIFEHSFKNDEILLKIDNINIHNTDVLIISETTRLEDLFNFSAKNILFKFINNNENYTSEKIINLDTLESIKNSINEMFKVNFIYESYDHNKILKSLFSTNNKIFLD
ncbi:UNVERIFIED_CONTAM: hypothetical protein O8I53_07410 [Campylobacter lari]